MNIIGKILESKYKPAIILCGCVLLALVLRVNHITLRPFWLDEANSVNLLKTASWKTVKLVESCPAYFLLMKGWYYFFGDSELSMRMLPTLLSLISILVIYQLGKDLFGRKAGLWSAFLLAVNYFSIFHSIQARQYSLIILVSIISSIFLVRFAKYGKMPNLILYVVCMILGVYLHPWMFLVAGAHFFWIAITNRKIIGSFLMADIVIFVSAIPHLRELLGFAGQGVNDWITAPTLSTFLDTFSFFIYESEGVYIALGIIAALSIFFKIKKSEQDGKESFSIEENNFNIKNIGSSSYFAVLYLFFPLICAWIISQFIPFYVAGRYEAAVLPGFILFFAVLFSKFRSSKIIIFTVLILAVFSYKSVDDEGKMIAAQKVNDKTVSQQLINNARSGDTIIFTDLSRPPFDYYFPRLNRENKKFDLFYFPREMEIHPAFQSTREMMKKREEIAKEAKNLAESIKNSKKENPSSVWVVYSVGNPVNEILFEELKNNLSLKEEIGLYHSRFFPGEASEVGPLHFQEILRFE
jgi:hypothetical protein